MPLIDGKMINWLGAEVKTKKDGYEYFTYKGCTFHSMYPFVDEAKVGKYTASVPQIEWNFRGNGYDVRLFHKNDLLETKNFKDHKEAYDYAADWLNSKKEGHHD